tara:strand:- start:9876 stop:13880 length:4005 start_codon:yes stop_codon:yes gene_type:complete
MRRRLLKIFVALIVFPSMAFADTVTYDYASDTAGTPGVDIFAYGGTTSSRPANSSTTPSNEFNSNNYSYIESDDNQFSTNQSSGNNSYASQRFTIEIDEDESSVSEMLINWKGYGTNSKSNQSDGVAFYIWNYSDSSYEEIGNTNNTTSETSLSIAISSDISDYINVNTVTLFATANDVANGNNQNNLIATNYVSLVITSENTPAVPIAEYRFDETEYNDVDGEIIENIAGLNGRSKVAQPVEGKICNAIDLSSSGTNDYAILDESILNGKTDFTVSLWEKTSKETNQSLVSGATSIGNSYNELIMWFPNTSTFQPHLKNGNNGNINTDSIADDTWHHLVWTRSGNQSCLFRDKVLQGCVTQSTAALNIESLILGQEQDSVGGGFVSSQAFDGLIDELLVFDSAISVTEIEQIYDNQNAGLGYDGSERTCPIIEEVSPIAEYRFEEDSWSGNTNEILDSSGNGYHGTPLRDSVLVNPAPSSAPAALTGNPGTCGYASQTSGSIQVTGLPLDTSTAGVKTTVTFWMNWNGTNNVMPVGWNIHDIWMINGDMGFNTGGGDIYGISSDGLANSWHHVAVEFTNGSVTNNKIHIDGVEQPLSQRRNSPNNNRAYVDSEFRIGGWSINTSYDFQGYMDEVRIYESALTTAQINTIMEERHACDEPAIDHYEIIHDGSGLTCNAETVTIKACTDSECNSLSSESITLDLQATSASSGIETKNSLSFDSGFAVASFNHFTAETILLSITNENINASNATVCDDSTGSSCDISFSDSGFIFDVPTQTACAVSNEITISAVSKDATSQQCVPSFENVSKTLKFWNTYDTPTTGSQPLTLTQNSTDYSLPNTEGMSVPITFDVNGEAIFQVTYPDAGQLTLKASYDENSSSSGSDLRMEGSNQFVSVPAKLVVATTDSNADCSTNDASCSAFKAAGEDFNFNVSATCADGTVTPNFQLNDITLSVNDIAPNIGNSVSLGITSIDISDADNGSHNESAQTISEVGVFSITATPSNLYFTETVSPATSASIGRFTPKYYQLGDIDNGELSGGNPFVYTGQMESSTSSIGQISYLTLPEFTITAKSASDTTTLNYTGDFIKLLESGIDRETPTEDANQLGMDATNKVDLASIFTPPAFSEYSPGVLKYQFNSTDHYVYSRNVNSLIAPFTAAIDLQINSVIDSDNIEATDLDNDTTNGLLTLQPQGLEIRFGRWIMENSYGPEISDIRMPMFTQYWNGNYFTTNDADSFTSFNATNASISDNQLSPSATPNLVGSGLFSSGETSELTVESPGADVRGSVTVKHDVPSWLKYDWSVVDESYDENPSATATFGLYRGNDRIIYRQEVFD